MNSIDLLTPTMGGLIIFLIMTVSMLAFYLIGGKKPSDNFRTIEAFRKLQEHTNRAIEEGKRVFTFLGSGGILGIKGAAGFAGLTIIKQVTARASQSDLPPSAASGEATLAILSQDTMNSVHETRGDESDFDPGSGNVNGLTPISYAVGSLSDITDDNVSTVIISGHFGSEVVLMTDAANRVNSQTVSGSENPLAQAIMYAASEDVLMGEELYASGAYLDKNPMHQASLRAQDLLRWILIGVIFFGALLKLIGVL